MTNRMICVLGIDPGLSGAIAFYYSSHPHLIAVEDMPIIAGDVSAADLAARINMVRPDAAIIELVGARPGQGVSSMFKFGKSFGVTIGVCQALKIPTHFVTPQKWKKHFGLGADKDESRMRATEYWPDRPELFAKKKHDGRAEAALIARYGAEVFYSAVAEPGAVVRQEEVVSAISSNLEGLA
jgi:hypothetical protein